MTATRTADPSDPWPILARLDTAAPRVEGCAECGLVILDHGDAGHEFEPPTVLLRMQRVGVRRQLPPD